MYRKPAGDFLMPGSTAQFEAASIRPNQTGDANMGAFGQPGARFGARNVPLIIDSVDHATANGYKPRDSKR
jgi:hypothetical protein